MKIGVIGAGIGGIGAAIRLACKGHEVTVFEANNYVGGKLAEFSLGGYRFDAGPSLFTMPQYVEELFILAGENPAQHFDYQRLDLVCQYFWDDDTALSAWADPNAFAEEAAKKLGINPQLLLNILADSQRKYHLTGKIFLEKSLHRLSTWLSVEVLRAFLAIPTLDIFKTMHQNHVRRLQGHEKLVQLFNRFATYNGSNPYKASGMLSIIPHFEHGIGAFYPKGGMFQITNSLHQLALRKGVTFKCGQRVREIIVHQGKVTGLQIQPTEGGNITPFQFDAVVSNMDIFFTYKKLMPNEKHPNKTLYQPRSTSAIIFYWGVKKTFPQLHLHNIFFSNDYKSEFEHLDAGKISDDPTIYLNITSKLTPSDAPEGCESWFILVNAPFNAGQKWTEIVRETRQKVIQKLSKNLKTAIEPLIEVEDVLDPVIMEQKTGSFAGSLYGTSSNNRMAAFARHPNFSNRIKNLYFCGGSVHPGGGVPLALLSGKIVSDNFISLPQ